MLGVRRDDRREMDLHGLGDDFSGRLEFEWSHWRASLVNRIEGKLRHPSGIPKHAKREMNACLYVRPPRAAPSARHPSEMGAGEIERFLSILADSEGAGGFSIDESYE
jgi:hypothetical protein